MYPLSIILGIAAYQSDKSVKKYVLPLSVIGACVSLYHYLGAKSSRHRSHEAMTQGVPCSGMYINWFGFITIPFPYVSS